MRSMRVLLGMAALLAATALSGCDQYQKPYKPLPDDLAIVSLDGATTLRKQDLLGKPWLINIWVPG